MVRDFPVILSICFSLCTPFGHFFPNIRCPPISFIPSLHSVALGRFLIFSLMQGARKVQNPHAAGFFLLVSFFVFFINLLEVSGCSFRTVWWLAYTQKAEGTCSAPVSWAYAGSTGQKAQCSSVCSELLRCERCTSLSKWGRLNTPS